MVLRQFVITLLSLLTLAALPARAEVVYPAGLRIGLEPPAGAVRSARFPGFEDPQRQVAISILDLPAAAYLGLEQATFANTQVGLQDVKRESFPFASGIGFLTTARAEQNGVKLYKWFFIAKAVVGPQLDLTAFVTVEVPEAARAVYTDDVVRAALSSISFRVVPLEEQLRFVPFKLGELAGFRVMQVIPAGVIITDGPSNDIAKQPYMIIGAVPGAPSEAGDRSRVARDLLSSAPLADLNVTSSELMRIDRSPGHEIRATAKGPDGRPLSLVQWVRFGSSGMLRIIAASSTEAWDALFPRFRAVRDGIEANN